MRWLQTSKSLSTRKSKRKTEFDLIKKSISCKEEEIKGKTMVSCLRKKYPILFQEVRESHKKENYPERHKTALGNLRSMGLLP